MKASKGVYVTKRSIKQDFQRACGRDNKMRVEHLIANCEVKRCARATQETGCQVDARRDLGCTCRLPGTKHLHEARFFSASPEQIYAYHGLRNYTNAGVGGSVKALQRRKVRKIYLPETTDRGVGHTDLSNFYIQKFKYTSGSYYGLKKTSSKCVGGSADYYNPVVSIKLSPIIKCHCATTGSEMPQASEKCIEISSQGNNTEDRKFVETTTQVEMVTNVVNTTVDPISVPNETKETKETPATKSQHRNKTIEAKAKAREEEKFSSDSLVQHIHDLECPSKQSRPSDDLVMENKIEREYRQIFATKSKSNQDQPAHDNKSTSLLRRRFEALRRGRKKEETKNTGEVASSSPASVISHKDVSIASDPPSLEARSYYSQRPAVPYTPAPNYDRTSYRRSVTGKKDRKGSFNSIEDENELNQGVSGMFRLWGKKFNLDDQKKVVKTDDNSKIEESMEEITGDAELPPTESKDVGKKPGGKKFSFFKKKSKDKTKPSYKSKKGVTANRCELKNGLVLKIAGTAKTHSTGPTETIKQENTTDNYEEIVRKGWLKKFLNNTIDSRDSVKIRWNNTTYTTSSSTVFELMDNVYKHTGIVIKSKSDITTHKPVKPSNNKRVNFIHQNIEAWMIPKTIPDRQMLIPIKNKSSPDKGDTKNIEVRLPDQKWSIDTAKTFSRKIELVLHSNNVVQLNNNVSSDFLRIDIPKGFFSDSTTGDEQEHHCRTSDEEVYKIVEYETLKSNSDVKKKPNFDTGDHASNEITVTVKVKDSKNVESKVLEKVLKKPPTQRDVVTQGSAVYFPKRYDVIGVGIITQRDVREVKPILNIQDDLSEDDSDPTTYSPKNNSEFAQNYLQEYYRHLMPQGIDLFSWCISDSNVGCCSEKTSVITLNHGDGSKSCPNINEELHKAASDATSSSHCGTNFEEEINNKNKIFFGRFFQEKSPRGKCPDKCEQKSKNTWKPDEKKRVLPKDSVEVFKKRRIYAVSQKKSKWGTSPPSQCGSMPSLDGCPSDDTNPIKSSVKSCPRNKKSNSKHVIVTQPCPNDPPPRLNSPPDCPPSELPCASCKPSLTSRPSCAISAPSPNSEPSGEPSLPCKSLCPSNKPPCSDDESPPPCLQNQNDACLQEVTASSDPSPNNNCLPKSSSHDSKNKKQDCGSAFKQSASCDTCKNIKSILKNSDSSETKPACKQIIIKSKLSSLCKMIKRATPASPPTPCGTITPVSPSECTPCHSEPSSSGHNICIRHCVTPPPPIVDPHMRSISPVTSLLNLPDEQNSSTCGPVLKNKRSCSSSGISIRVYPKKKDKIITSCTPDCKACLTPRCSDNTDSSLPSEKSDLPRSQSLMQVVSTPNSKCRCTSCSQASLRQNALHSPPFSPSSPLSAQSDVPNNSSCAKQHITPPSLPNKLASHPSLLPPGFPLINRPSSPSLHLPNCSRPKQPCSPPSSPPNRQFAAKKLNSPPLLLPPGFPLINRPASPPLHLPNFPCSKQPCSTPSSPPNRQFAAKKLNSPPSLLPPGFPLINRPTSPPLHLPNFPCSKQPCSPSSSLPNRQCAAKKPASHPLLSPPNFPLRNRPAPPLSPLPNCPRPKQPFSPPSSPPNRAKLATHSSLLPPNFPLINRPANLTHDRRTSNCAPPSPGSQCGNQSDSAVNQERLSTFPYLKQSNIPLPKHKCARCISPGVAKLNQTSTPANSPLNRSSAPQLHSRNYIFPKTGSGTKISIPGYTSASQSNFPQGCPACSLSSRLPPLKNKLTNKFVSPPLCLSNSQCGNQSGSSLNRSAKCTSPVLQKSNQTKSNSSPLCSAASNDSMPACASISQSKLPTQCPALPPLENPKCSKNMKSKFTGIFLRKYPKKNSSSEVCEVANKRVNACDTNDEIREMKLRDEDGLTLCERREYKKPKRSNHRPSVLGDMYDSSNVCHRVSTHTSPHVVISNDKQCTLPDRSSQSLANLVEIEFKMRVTQGDKITEINIGNDGDSDKEKVTKINANASREVYVVHNKASEPITVNNSPGNDIDIRIVIKNFKTKTKKMPRGKVKKESVFDEFTRKISEKFHTVSTGYSDIVRSNAEQTGSPSNTFSVHRATWDLTCASDDKTKAGKTSGEQSDYTEKETTNVNTNTSQSATILSDYVIKDDEIPEKPVVEEKSCLSINNTVIKSDTTKQEGEANFFTDDTDLDNCIVSSSDTAKREKTSKAEKKKMLKMVIEKAGRIKHKNKDKVSKITRLLRNIMTSDSSDHTDMAVTKNDLAKDITYASLPPNVLRDTDSMNNLYKTSSMVSENEDQFVRLNTSKESGDMSYEDEPPATKTCAGASCLCNQVATKLNLPCSGGCCCRSKKPEKVNMETNCDIRTNEDMLLLNYGTSSFIDQETQRSRLLLSKANSVNVTFFKNVLSNELNIFSVSEVGNLTSISLDKSSQEGTKKIKKTSSPEAIDNMLNLSDEDKIIIANMEPTKYKIETVYTQVLHKGRRGKDKFDDVAPADILQSYETKKAVLEMYTERTLSEGGEHLVAKLPKFSLENESDIIKYEKICTRSVIFSVER